MNFNMNKSVLKKIALELNIKLKGDKKAFIFVICSKYLKNQNILNRDSWLRNFLSFNGKIKKEVWDILENLR